MTPPLPHVYAGEAPFRLLLLPTRQTATNSPPPPPLLKRPGPAAMRLRLPSPLLTVNRQVFARRLLCLLLPLTRHDGGTHVFGVMVDGASGAGAQRKVWQLDGLVLGWVIEGRRLLGPKVAVGACRPHTQRFELLLLLEGEAERSELDG